MYKNDIKRILVEKLESEILQSLRENSSKNPMAGTPMEGMFLLEIINNECERFKGFLHQMKSKINIEGNDIDDIISTASKNINRQVFDNFDDDEENFDDFDEDFMGEDEEKFNEDKFTISSLFYQFCFANEVASLFLNKGAQGNEIAKDMANTKFEHESVTLIMFKAYLRKFNIEFENNGQDYSYKSFDFTLSVERTVIGNESNYFEILSNNISEVKSQDDLELAVANHYVVYVEKYHPKSLYAIVYDPYIQKYAVRAVFENGISSKVAFIDNDERDLIIDTILEFE